jgi:MoaA/NifB/PqqE/SkfB family radical SAM enzyme
MNSKTFCVVPFIGGCINPSGNMHICCNSVDVGTYSFKEIDKWRNSDAMIQLREDLFYGIENKYCRRCWTSQQLGEVSLRQAYNQSLVDADIVKQIKSISKNNFIVEDNIKFLDLKLGNLCNLKCVMCTPSSSSRILSEWKANKDIFPLVEKFDKDYTWPEREEFRSMIEPILPNLKYVQFTGGEPFLNPYIEEILAKLPEDCIVHISTNLTVIDDTKIKLLQKFKNLWLTASADAVGELYEYIRFPGIFSEFEENLTIILNSLPAANFSIAVTVGILTLQDIDTTVNYFTDRGCKIEFIMIDNPEHLGINSIPDAMSTIIVEKIGRIKDKNVAKYLLQILGTRKYNTELHNVFEKYVEDINKIRKLNFKT